MERLKRTKENITEELPVQEPVIDPVQTETSVEKAIRWKKVGGGSFIFNNRIIKPGQIFTAKVSEIPKAFRDLIIPQDELPMDESVALNSNPNYDLRANGDLWDVVSKQGKKINEKSMSREDAVLLIRYL